MPDGLWHLTFGRSHSLRDTSKNMGHDRYRIICHVSRPVYNNPLLNSIQLFVVPNARSHAPFVFDLKTASSATPYCFRWIKLNELKQTHPSQVRAYRMSQSGSAASMHRSIISR